MLMRLPTPAQRSRTGLLPSVGDLRRAVFVGVSYMIPFIAAGGLLQAFGLLLGGSDVAHTPATAQHPGAVLFGIGTLAFGMLAPALSGYIAFALADRPGLVPGITAGLAAASVGAGFLGGLAGGVLAGLAARLLGRLKGEPFTVVLAPTVATLISAGTMLGLLGPPLGALSRTVTSWLGSLNGADAVLLGAVLGVMIAIDLGGPVNKVAYTFATAGLTAGGVGTAPMAAVMAAGMCVPLGLALATRLRPAAFAPKERAHAPTATALGALFITEGAIPFAVADPLRVMPAALAGAASAGALSMGLHATLDAPHGGVLALFAAGDLLAFLAAIALGTLVTAVAVICAKETRSDLRGRTAQSAG
jgi:PTS system fructose-specific IIC component